MTAFTPPLTRDVYVTALEPTVSDDLPPGARQRLFSPTAATLICGERDAVLVDAPLTVGQASALSDRIAAHGKHLTATYLTPGYDDRWFGLSVILERFADARAFALPSVIAQMHQGSTPESLSTFREPLFPSKLPEQLVLPDPLPDHTLMLEGRNLVAVELEHTDTDATSWLHVPEIGLVVAGDGASNDVLLYLAESSPCSHGPLSPVTSAPVATMVPSSSRRPADTSATSTDWQRGRAPRWTSTSRCSRSTPHASTPARSGARRGRSRDEAP